MEKMRGKTAFQKIVESHLLRTLSDGSLVLWLDWIWGHEITTPLAFKDIETRGLSVFNPNQIKMMIDHVSPAKDTDTAIQGKIMREFCRAHSIELVDIGKGAGICHAKIPEAGWVSPGQIGVMGDSHTCTESSVCAVTFGVGTTELEAALITGIAVLPPQKVIRVNFTGKLPANVFAKDLILELIKRISVKGATNCVLEFGGPAIDEMSMEGRMTISNMSVECGATCGIINIDQKTIKYLRPAIKKRYGYLNRALSIEDCQRWNSDPDAEYFQVIEIDVTNMTPVTTINYSVGDVVPVSELVGKKVDQVFIGSCTNGRIEDLRIAASIIRQMGGKVARDVRVIVIPATQYIYERALKEELIEIFLKAGCSINSPSCGACLGMSCGVLAPGEICLSTTNRNFKGRMGEGGMVHLASPATAAFTAVKGAISEPTIEICEQALKNCRNAPQGEAVKLTDWKDTKFAKPDFSKLAKTFTAGQAWDFSGKASFLPEDNVDTDQIIPGKYLSLTSKEEFGKHCLEGIEMDPEKRVKLHGSQILVTGANFGSGSSREQAIYALEGVGIKCVIALSFARIFENNMFANGHLCITLPNESVRQLLEENPEEISIDWENGTVQWSDGNTAEFELSEHRKDLIRSGGLIGVMIKIAAELQK